MSSSECKRCILDTTDKEIRFDENGVCNYCNGFEEVKVQLKNNLENQESFFTELKKEDYSQTNKKSLFKQI